MQNVQREMLNSKQFVGEGKIVINPSSFSTNIDLLRRGAFHIEMATNDNK